MVPPHSTDRWLLGDLQSVTTGAGTRCRWEEAAFVHVRASVHDVEHHYHVPVTAMVPELREVQLLQSLFVWQLPELRDKASCPSLDTLHSLRVSDIKKSPRSGHSTPGAGEPRLCRVEVASWRRYGRSCSWSGQESCSLSLRRSLPAPWTSAVGPTGLLGPSPSMSSSA